jgi:hypothetical protein
MVYSVPAEHYLRLRHSRPRFKNQIEDVLYYMSSEICRIGVKETSDFNDELNGAIRRFPGNANLTIKTINNWRTEIDALFGLIVKTETTQGPSKLAQYLYESQDLMTFFKAFLTKFQYPGGHVKPSWSAELINKDVKFKPASFVIRVLLAGQSRSEDGMFWLSKAEAASLIWNDLRVTTGTRTEIDVVEDVIQNRKSGISYDSDGDVTRYAGDILDYMVLANILRPHYGGRYTLVKGVMKNAQAVISDVSFFEGYEALYKTGAATGQDVAAVESSWFDYAGNSIDFQAEQIDPLEVLEALADNTDDSVEGKAAHDLLGFLRDKINAGENIATKETGDVGENIVLRHEFNRLKALGEEKLGKKVKKIPDKLGVGYDIKSFRDASQDARFIEVKSSISHGKLNIKSFHLTRNEWKVAETSGDSYFVFRVLISTNSVNCFVLQNPVDKYKKDLVSMSINKDGSADITFTDGAGAWENLLIS